MYNICLICSSLTLTARLKPAQLTTTKFGQFNGENDDHITSARASVYYRVTFFEDLFFLSHKRKTPEKKHFSHSKKDRFFVRFPPRADFLTIDGQFGVAQTGWRHCGQCCQRQRTAYCCHLATIVTQPTLRLHERAPTFTMMSR